MYESFSGVMFDLGPYGQGLMCSFTHLMHCTSFVFGPRGKSIYRVSKSINRDNKSIYRDTNSINRDN